MNTTPNPPTQAMEGPNGTFTFAAVVRFEIDPDTAAGLLVESDPSKAISAWINQAHVKENSGDFNTTNLRDGLNVYLGEKAIEKARLLLPCTDESKLIC